MTKEQVTRWSMRCCCCLEAKSGRSEFLQHGTWAQGQGDARCRRMGKVREREGGRWQ